MLGLLKLLATNLQKITRVVRVKLSLSSTTIRHSFGKVLVVCLWPTRDYDLTAWGFQRRGWGRRPSEPQTHAQTAGKDPRLPSRLDRLTSPAQLTQRTESGGWVSTASPNLTRGGGVRWRALRSRHI